MHQIALQHVRSQDQTKETISYIQQNCKFLVPFSRKNASLPLAGLGVIRNIGQIKNCDLFEIFEA